MISAFERADRHFNLWLQDGNKVEARDMPGNIVWPGERTPIVLWRDNAVRPEEPAHLQFALANWGWSDQGAELVTEVPIDLAKTHPSYAPAYHHRRCLIPLSVWYVLAPEGQYHIQSADPFPWVAGLWTAHYDDAQRLEFVALNCPVTCPLPRLIRAMPAVVNFYLKQAWLEGEETGFPNPGWYASGPHARQLVREGGGHLNHEGVEYPNKRLPLY